MKDVRNWLESLGLGQYGDVFDKNAIEPAQLPDLDHEVLQAIGVKAAGHRVKILKAAAQLASSAHVERQQEDSASRSTSQDGSGEAERRQLTVMFADLVGSTELSQRLDPEVLREINRLYQDAAKSAIEQFEGYVARYMATGS